VPEPLVGQLKTGGIMVIPVCDEMISITKTGQNKIEKTILGYYAFVPLIGKYGHAEK
jgi:protein-L-isoaspartate O-methyltransferase